MCMCLAHAGFFFFLRVKLNGEEINVARDLMVTAAKQVLNIVRAFM